MVNGVGSWEMGWKRALQGDEESSQWSNCKQLITSMVINGNQDEWVWSHGNSKTYTCASLKWLIDRRMFTQMDGLYENNTLIPIKVNFLHWRLLLNCTPTRASLTRKGAPLNSLVCLICANHDEDTNHLFAFYGFPRQIWTQLGCGLKILIIPSGSLESVLNMGQYGYRNGSLKQIMIESVLTWLYGLFGGFDMTRFSKAHIHVQRELWRK